MDHTVKIKVSEKIDKYLDLGWELKKLWNMKVKAIPTVVGALRTVARSLEMEVEEFEIIARLETIQTTALLRSAWIIKRIQETWGSLLSLMPQWKTISKPSYEKLKKKKKKKLWWWINIKPLYRKKQLNLYNWLYFCTGPNKRDI